MSALVRVARRPIALIESGKRIGFGRLCRGLRRSAELLLNKISVRDDGLAAELPRQFLADQSGGRVVRRIRRAWVLSFA